MCVNSGQHTYTVNAPFYPNAGQNYHFSSSFSHNTGVSMYVNGQLVGSQTKPSNNHYNPNAGHQQPLCFGSCGSNPAPGSQNVNMANSIMAGAGIHDLMTNSLLGCLGTTALNIITSTLFPKPGNLFPWLHPQSKSTLPTTTTYATPIAPFSAATSAPTLPTVGKRGPLCYDCHDQSSINSCTNLTQCDQTQVCLVFEHIDGFEHRCMEKNKCSQLQSVSTNLCWTCCSEDLCNKHCTPTQQHRVPTPVTTVKTTQPPFTVSATSPIASNIVQTMCSDNPQCAQLVTAGYSVCSDPVVSRSLCKNKCSNCP
ncbi:uncharacterized protein LOC128212311 [Mya arenaria]|uniref:uncharacterized protein LOC128212311 n=1 Tax=Mya arenaria TaxID=6604 RepID=UPI0022E27350|nr:uncharacterized protein LOC128212311 [Mya arenaria]